jgi:hypothetical protein
LNRFCGNCGAQLNAPAEHSPEKDEPAISGPSFLGLGDAPPEDEPSYTYLLEEERHRGRAATLIVIVILIAAGIAVAWKWNAIRQYMASINRPPVATSPNTADHSDTSVGADAQPAVPAPPAPQQQAGTQTPPPMTDQAQKQALPQGAPEEGENKAQPPSSKNDKSAAPAKPPEPVPSPDEKADTEEPAATPKPSPARDKTASTAPTDERGAHLLLTGENYLYGRGVSKSCDQAVVYLKAAASARNPKAMGHLGAMYATGNCVSMDRAAAYHWFAQARQADPKNPWYDQNMGMLIRDMTPDERLRSGAK